MNVEIVKRFMAHIKCIKPINNEQRESALHDLGALMWTSLGLTGDALAEKLSEVNRAKCVALPLSEQEVAQIACSAEEQAKQKVCCRTSGIILLDFDVIPTDELVALMKKIETLPYVATFGFSSRDVKSPNLRSLLADLQADLIHREIGKLCGYMGSE